MKSSITSYSFQPYIRARKMTHVDTVKAAYDLGFDAIEFTDMQGEDYETQCENARKIRAEADKYGVKVISYTIAAQLYQETEEEICAEIERIKKQVDIAAILGCPTMRHDTTFKYGETDAGRSFDLMLPTIARAAREITEYAATKGIKTCTENHGFISQDSDRVERLVNAVNNGNFGVLVDMGNFTCADEQPHLAVSRVAPYAFHVHAKDFIIRDKECKVLGGFWTRGASYLIPVAVGEGDVPVERCLRILRIAGYDGYVTIEYEGSADSFEGIKIAKANLDKYIAAVCEE